MILLQPIIKDSHAPAYSTQHTVTDGHRSEQTDGNESDYLQSTSCTLVKSTTHEVTCGHASRYPTTARQRKEQCAKDTIM